MSVQINAPFARRPGVDTAKLGRIQPARLTVFAIIDYKAGGFGAHGEITLPQNRPPGAHGLASGVGHRFGIVEIIFVVEIAVDDLCAVLGINAVPAAAFKTVFAHNAGRRPDEIIGFVAQDQPALFGLFGGGVEKFLRC